MWMQLNEHISLKLSQLFSAAISALMCAVSLHFSALPWKAAPVSISMAKHVKTNKKNIIVDVIYRKENTKFVR